MGQKGYKNRNRPGVRIKHPEDLDAFFRRIKQNRLPKPDLLEEEALFKSVNPDKDKNRVQKAILDRFIQSPFVDIWRQNNHATRGRSFIGRYGIGDLSGLVTVPKLFGQTLPIPLGLRLEIEVKTEGDDLSDEQREFLQGVRRGGGIAFVAGSLEEAIHKFKAEYFRLTGEKIR